MIQCADCGSWYGSKTWHTGTKYEKRIWRCNHKYDNGQHRTTPPLDDDSIKKAFMQVLIDMLSNTGKVDQLLEDTIRTELDTTHLEAAAEKLLTEVESAADAIDGLINRNAKDAINQDEYATHLTRSRNAMLRLLRSTML